MSVFQNNNMLDSFNNNNINILFLNHIKDNTTKTIEYKYYKAHTNTMKQLTDLTTADCSNMGSITFVFCFASLMLRLYRKSTKIVVHV